MTDDAQFSLVMPFVVTRSHGGPYDDESFVAGCAFGDLARLLRQMPPEVTTFRCVEYVDLLPQIDLLAMHERWTVTRDPDDTDSDWADEWACLTLTRVPPHDDDEARP